MTRLEPRETFDDDPESYHLARPGYPEDLYAILADRCGLGAGSQVLEIGPGTGQATRDLLAHGAEVTAVELGAGLAARLREALPDPRLRIVVGDIAATPLPDDAFDLAVCATAFHWVDPVVVIPALAKTLRPNGSLAVWWNVVGDPERPGPFEARLREVWREFAPKRPTESVAELGPSVLRTAERIADFQYGGHFGEVAVDQLRWELRLTALGARRLFSTFSTLKLLPPESRELLLDRIAGLIEEEFGGEVRHPYVTVVYTARKSA